MKIWQCKIGESVSVPKGADAPMREAVARAYKELTGEEPTFIFSGWGAKLTEPERAVVEDRLPVPQAAEPVNWEDAQRIADLPEVDELLSGFADDPTGDAGTMIVRAVMQAVGQPAASAEPVADAAIKAAYVRAFGSENGWPDEPGSWFIEGYRAATAVAQEPMDLLDAIDGLMDFSPSCTGGVAGMVRGGKYIEKSEVLHVIRRCATPIAQKPAAYWLEVDGKHRSITTSKFQADEHVKLGGGVRPLVFGDAAPVAQEPRRIGKIRIGNNQHPYATLETAYDEHGNHWKGGEAIYAAPVAAPVAAQPIDMILYCPACGIQHIDAPTDEWTNPPHHSHLCHNCGHIWRPADMATNGVDVIKTRGEKDSPQVAQQTVGPNLYSFLKRVINLCSHVGESPDSIVEVDSRDKWVADLWNEAKAYLAVMTTKSRASNNVAELSIVTDGMVNRFFDWCFPPDFNPSGGISFDRIRNYEDWPCGKDLLTAAQVRRMLEYVLKEAVKNAGK